jgi:hypothetical protein
MMASLKKSQLANVSVYMPKVVPALREIARPPRQMPRADETWATLGGAPGMWGPEKGHQQLSRAMLPASRSCRWHITEWQMDIDFSDKF